MRLRAARLAALACLLLFIALASTAAGANASVDIANFAFDPATVTINAGETVTWTNHDQAAHSAAFVNGGPKTPILTTGKSASLTFTVAGNDGDGHRASDRYARAHRRAHGRADAGPHAGADHRDQPVSDGHRERRTNNSRADDGRVGRDRNGDRRRGAATVGRERRRKQRVRPRRGWCRRARRHCRRVDTPSPLGARPARQLRYDE